MTRVPDGRDSVARRAARLLGTGARRAAEALATPLLPADFLSLIDPLRFDSDLRGRVVSLRRATPSATDVVIRPGRGWKRHVAGQYIRVGLEVDGVRHWRAYSLTGPTDAATISITVRAIPGGKVSNHVLHRLRPGDLVHLDQATGDFTLPTPPPSKLLFLTAGSGITPVIGMLRNYPDLADVVVVHSAPSAEEMLFREELRAMDHAGRIRFVERITGSGGSEVRLPVDQVGDAVGDWRERQTWACGPNGLLDDAEHHWRFEGIPDRLHTERFRPRITAVGNGGDITFDPSGTTVHAGAATTVLDAGEEAGLIMPSGCRMGICFNCVLPLHDGSVRDLRTGEITTTTLEDPLLVQTCVSAAAGACRIVL